jgi:penicillin-binding protein-related factor A (putative recombinase)
MHDWKKTEIAFANHWRVYGKRAWVHRFSDTAQAIGMNGKDTIAPSQPSDFLVTLEGQTFFAEVKHSTEPVSFSHSKIRKQQMNCARMCVPAGGAYFFFIYAAALKKWFCVPAHVITTSATKSTKWADITQYEWKINAVS